MVITLLFLRKNFKKKTQIKDVVEVTLSNEFENKRNLYLGKCLSRSLNFCHMCKLSLSKV